jgi:hypothetical protein
MVEAGLRERRANEGIQSVAVSEAGLKPEIFETNSANTCSAWRGLDYTLLRWLLHLFFPPVLASILDSACLPGFRVFRPSSPALLRIRRLRSPAQRCALNPHDSSCC